MHNVDTCDIISSQDFRIRKDRWEAMQEKYEEPPEAPPIRSARSPNSKRSGSICTCRSLPGGVSFPGTV